LQERIYRRNGLTSDPQEELSTCIVSYPPRFLSSQLRHHTHREVLRHLVSHRLLDRLGKVPLRVELADMSRLELFWGEGCFFLYGFGVCGSEAVHLL
jgi:hypothetical protein